MTKVITEIEENGKSGGNAKVIYRALRVQFKFLAFYFSRHLHGLQ